jgi:hypothetical protein
VLALTKRIVSPAIGLAGVAAVALVGNAFASGPNAAATWEDGPGGIYVHGIVQIKASYSDGGLHAKQGYIRLTRKSGPSLDTGRLYTQEATSKTDTNSYERQKQVTDSVLSGADYTTHFYYGFIWFGGGSCGSTGEPGSGDTSTC